jgi:general secretion pathway protein G
MNLTASSAFRRSAGFTLMELMLVLGIITLLIAAGMKMAPIITKTGKNTAATADIGSLNAIILGYQNKHAGKLPLSLEKLVSSGDMTENMLNDPWGNPYKLEIPNKRSKTEKFDVFSMGHDGLPNTADDVGNFESAQ